MDPVTRRLDLDDASKTENTRGRLPARQSIPNTVEAKRAGHPSNIVMLTADAFGVLPPIAKLTSEEAMTMFLAGYTAKVAGTEVGVVEPQATFSACFGAAFLPQPPSVYAELLGERIERARRVGLARQHRLDRRPLRHRLAHADRRHPRHRAAPRCRASSTGPPTRTDPIFGFEVPTAIAGVDSGLLDPRSTWADKDAYDASAKDLAARILEHAAKMTA